MSISHFYRVLTATVVFTIPAALARADFDVRPYLSGGTIITGGFDDAASQNLAQAHAFGYMFGEDPLLPFTITDPGFNAVTGGLTAGTQLNFQVHSSLLYWDGTGAITFATAPAGVMLDLEKFLPPSSLLDVTITGSSGPQNGFSIGTVLGGGSIHQHLSSTLSTTGGGTPVDGVYAVAVSLLLDANESTRSDRFYLAYGSGVDETVLDDAVSVLDANAVPEPSSLMVLGLGAAACAYRRRLRSREI